MNWIGCLNSLNSLIRRLPAAALLLAGALLPAVVLSQPNEQLYRPGALEKFQAPAVLQDTARSAAGDNAFPAPKQVMYKSMMVPGWGQVVNKQIWKVPIVYGLLAGLTIYSIRLNKSYHDYRAAYYNAVYGEEGDFKYGPTPGYIPENANQQSLKYNRNYYRNRRDFIYITIGLAYGLNVLDAYVFAHLRSFDVSDDLSMKTRIQPALMADGSPGMTLQFRLSR